MKNMKPIINFKKGTRIARFPHNLILRSLVLGTLIIAGFQVSAQTQDAKYSQPKWWFGAAAGANLNFYRGTTQQIDADLTAPTAFHNGKGVGLFAFPIVEYHPDNSRLGF